MTQKTILIRSQPTFIVPMSKDEIGVLMQCASRHYDRQCQLMAQPIRGPGTRNGVLVIWEQNVASSLSFAPDETPTVSASFGDLDRCLKVLEGASGALDNDAQKALAVNLRGAFRQALQDANVLTQQWSGQSVYQAPAHEESSNVQASSGFQESALTSPRRGRGPR